jgi:hypothetical protein
VVGAPSTRAFELHTSKCPYLTSGKIPRVALYRQPPRPAIAQARAHPSNPSREPFPTHRDPVVFAPPASMMPSGYAVDRLSSITQTSQHPPSIPLGPFGTRTNYDRPATARHPRPQVARQLVTPSPPNPTPTVWDARWPLPPRRGTRAASATLAQASPCGLADRRTASHAAPRPLPHGRRPPPSSKSQRHVTHGAPTTPTRAPVTTSNPTRRLTKDADPPRRPSDACFAMILSIGEATEALHEAVTHFIDAASDPIDRATICSDIL